MHPHRLWTILLFLVASASVAGAQLRGEEIRRALAGLQDPERRPESVAFELAAFGREVAPALLEVLDEGLPGLDGEARPPSPLERRILLQALGQLGRDVVRPLIDKEQSRRRPDLSRVTLLAALGEVGRAYDLFRALEIATPSRSRDRVEREVAEELRSTCERILRRDQEGHRLVRSLVPQARPELRKALLAGTAGTRTREALASLAGILGLVPELDPLLLAHVASVARHVPGPIETDVLEEIRPYLWESDESLRREAVLATGAVRDEEAIGRLIQICSQETGSLRAAGFGALEEITGLAFGADVERWRLWFQKEKSWLRDEAPRCFAALRSDDPAGIGRALNQLVQRRVFKRELASAVEPLLDRGEAAVRRRACLALARLGSWDQVPRLVSLLEDHDETVVHSAHAALVSITGRDLPPRFEAWQGIAPGPGDA